MCGDHCTLLARITAALLLRIYSDRAIPQLASARGVSHGDAAVPVKMSPLEDILYGTDREIVDHEQANHLSDLITNPQ